MSATAERPDVTARPQPHAAMAPHPQARSAAGLTFDRVNPLEHRAAIKQLFLDHARPEFVDYFDRAYPDAVADGATSWVGWDHGGRLCAHIAQFPREFAVGGRRVRGALLANLMVAADHRTFWPALALARRVVTDLKAGGTFDFVYADPNEQARPVLAAAGFRPVGTLRRFVLPLNDERRIVGRVLHLYHHLGRWNTTPLVAMEWGAVDGADIPDPVAAGGPRSLRPVRHASLYASRLAGFPTARDRWYTFHSPGPERLLVGKALIRGPDDHGVALVCALPCDPTKLRSLLAALVRRMAATGAARLEAWVMFASHEGRALRRAGFVQRPECVPIIAQPLTTLGAETMAPGCDWQLLPVDLDR